MSRRTDSLIINLNDENADVAKLVVATITDRTAAANETDRRRRANFMAEVFLSSQRDWPTEAELTALNDYAVTR